MKYKKDIEKCFMEAEFLRSEEMIMSSAKLKLGHRFWEKLAL